MKYVGYDQDHCQGAQKAANPGPIDNSHLLKGACIVIKCCPIFREQGCYVESYYLPNSIIIWNYQLYEEGKCRMIAFPICVSATHIS